MTDILSDASAVPLPREGLDSLVDRLLPLEDAVRDEMSLLGVACRILDGAAAVLVQGGEDGSGGCAAATVGIVVSRPSARPMFEALAAPEASQLAAALPPLFSGPDGQPPAPPRAFFMTLGQSVRLAGRDFADVLWVSGESTAGASAGPDHQLFVLARPESGGSSGPVYFSHHCWAAQRLLGRFELHWAFRRRTELLLEVGRAAETRSLVEQAARRVLSENLESRALPGLGWETLKDSIRQLLASKPREAVRHAFLWLAYQRRRGQTVPDDAVAYLQSLSAAGSDNARCAAAIFQEAETATQNAARADFAVPDSTHSIRQLSNNLVAARPYCAADAGDARDRQIWAALALETLWQKVREHSAHANPLAELFRFTRAFLADVLTAPSADPATGSAAPAAPTTAVPPPPPPQLVPIDRDRLRTYFAWLLVSSDALRTRYVEDYDPKSNKGRYASPQLRRSFQASLARLMLDVIERCQRRLGLWTDEFGVSAEEKLDALLYLVDRYAHVDLGVDERFDIQDQLTRSLGAEVRLYLGRPSYRDHLAHVVDVFLLGHLLLHAQFKWGKAAVKRTFVGHISELRLGPNRDASLTHTEASWLQNWAVAALLHDVGYQALARDPGVPRDKVLAAYLDLPAQGALPAAPAEDDARFARRVRHTLQAALDGLTCIVAELPEYGLPFDALMADHGILSALRIVQSLNLPAGVSGDGPETRFDFSQRGYVQAFHAIATHNLAGITVGFETHPLACLLRLCDEVQEWQRHRVDIESMVKRFYLRISALDDEPFNAFDLFRAVRANVRLLDDATKTEPSLLVELAVPGDARNVPFAFRLDYEDAVRAKFDPLRVVLSKAYGLQQVGLAVSEAGHFPLRWSIDLHFPRPPAYGNLTEYDIFALFTERVRDLKLLRRFDSAEEADGGLVLVAPTGATSSPPEDVFGIVVTGAATEDDRHGWLIADPSPAFAKLEAFRREVLRPRGDG